MKSTITLLLVFATVTLSISCNRKTVMSKEDTKKDYKPAIVTEAGPPVIIYKMKSDYSGNVPVILSADKKEIINYPAITDVYYKGELALPVSLGNGYYLDRRGINEHVAFLEISYEEYANLQDTPSVDELFDMIMDADPLLEMYHCGSAYDYDNLEEEMMQRTESADFKSCTRLK